MAVFYINVDQLNQVYVAFTESPEAAARVEKRVAAFAELAGGNAARRARRRHHRPRPREAHDRGRRQPGQGLPDQLEREPNRLPFRRWCRFVALPVEDDVEGRRGADRDHEGLGSDRAHRAGADPDLRGLAGGSDRVDRRLAAPRA